jgi:hypothetical protein
MRKQTLAKAILNKKDIDLSKHEYFEIGNSLVRWVPKRNADGMCYDVSTIATSFQLGNHPSDTVTCLFNRRGGKPHGRVYSLSNFNIVGASGFMMERPLSEFYGRQVMNTIKKSPYYNSVVFLENGVVKKECLLAPDITNPENIIVWREQNFKYHGGRGGYYTLHGRYLRLDGDQSIYDCGNYIDGIKEGAWIKKQKREGGLNKLLELNFETNGKVITALLRGNTLINKTKSNNYLLENGDLFYTMNKKIVGKIHNGRLM